MSERTLESKLARSRDSAMADVNRWSSRRWSWRTSRWRERLFCLRAEDVRVASESSKRESWEMRASRWIRYQQTIRIRRHISDRQTHSFEEVFQLRLCSQFLFCRVLWRFCERSELGVCMEEGFCLLELSVAVLGQMGQWLVLVSRASGLVAAAVPIRSRWTSW